MINPTPTENKQIALLREWRYDPERPNRHQWQSPITGWWQEHPPDYLHDKALAMMLLEEMASARNWTVNIDSLSKETEWLVYLQEDSENVFDISGKGDILTEAISHTWLAWQKEEGNG